MLSEKHSVFQKRDDTSGNQVAVVVNKSTIYSSNVANILKNNL